MRKTERDYQLHVAAMIQAHPVNSVLERDLIKALVRRIMTGVQ